MIGEKYCTPPEKHNCFQQIQSKSTLLSVLCSENQSSTAWLIEMWRLEGLVKIGATPS